MLSMNTMMPREKGHAIGQLFDFWKFKAGPDGLPVLNDFSYKTALPPEVLRNVCWADVTPDDPFNFVTQDHAKLTAFSDASNRRLGQHQSRMHYRACASEYLISIRERVPIYHEIDQAIGDISRHYVRLMLPVVDKMGRVVRLVYAVRIVKGATSSSS